MTIHFTKATTGGGGGGGGGDKPGGSGNSGQSGVYTYPSTAAGGTGASGTGHRLGQLRHRLRAPGSYRHRLRQLRRRRRLELDGALARAAGPVDGSGPAQAVQGYQVQGEEGVSGVPLRAAEGAQAPEPERPGPPVPVARAHRRRPGRGGGVLRPLAVRRRAHPRRITGFDHTRPERFLPFRPLGK